MLISRIEGLTSVDLSAVLNTYDLKPWYYPTLMPLRETATLNWEMLAAQAGLKVAADIVARGATAPKKGREIVSVGKGDIPKIMIAREKTEKELTEYDLLLYSARNSPDARQLVEWWAEDVQFCWNGVAARAEILALEAISTGKIRVTPDNNSAVVTEFDVDYNVPIGQKIGVAKPYAGTDATPLKDFENAIQKGKEIGVSYKYAFMNKNTFLKLAKQEEVVKRTASLISNLAGAMDAPNLTNFNAYLKQNSERFNGIEVIVIDQDITIDSPDGMRRTYNPFADNVITFSDTRVLGATYWKRPIEAQSFAGSSALKAMNGHTLIKKYSDESPVREVTEGIANLFPVWNGAARATLMDTGATTWQEK